MKRPADAELVRAGGLDWWMRRGVRDDNLQALLADPDGSLERAPQLIKSGRGRQSTIGAFHGLVLKRYNQNKPLNYFKDLFRPSRARRAYACAEMFARLGIPTPRVIAAAERRCCRVLLRSYLVAEEIAPAADLRSMDRLPLGVACRAGEVVGKMHQAGFTHDDLKEANLIVDGAGEVYVLDLDGVDHVGAVSWGAAASNLERLDRGARSYPYVGAAQRLAFLRGYCRARGLRRVPRMGGRRKTS